MKEVEEGNLFLEGDSFCGECDEDDDISINDIYIYIKLNQRGIIDDAKRG